MKKIFAAAILAGAPLAAMATNPGEVLINEAMIVGVGADGSEFVELKGAVGHDLSDCELLLVNGGTVGAPAYDTVDLAGRTIGSSGYFVISGNATNVPNTDFVDFAVTNAIQNGDPDAIVLRRKSDQVVIDALGYFALHNVGTPNLGTAPLVAGTHFIGAPTGLGGDDAWPTQTGTSARVAPPTVLGANTNASIGRYPDGVNTSNNYYDFSTLFLVTPGASNSGAPALNLPISEPFTTASGLTQVWAPSFTSMILETAATAVPASIPNSPDAASPDQWVSVKDNSGGGEGTGIIGIGTNYAVSVYAFNATTVLPEFLGLVARLKNLQNNTSFNFDQDFDGDTDFGSGYGDFYYGLTMNMQANTVQAYKVDKGLRTAVGSAVNVTADTWVKLEVICDNDVVTFEVNDVVAGTLTGQPVIPGYVGLGYYEADASTGSVRANFDALSITAPSASVEEWSLLD